MTRVWQRYFISELLKIFILFIISFYFLYVLIDYSAHAKIFQTGQISFFGMTLYYGSQFTRHADMLLPISLMIASIKVLTTSNVRKELLALAAGGISLKEILRPFLLMSIFFACLLYLNFQFVQPSALQQIENFEERYFKEHAKNDSERQVQTVFLEDGSLFIYQFYHPNKKCFFDTYWVKNHDLIYRIHTLFPHENTPLGHCVDILERKSSGDIVKIESHASLSLPEMYFNPKTLYNETHPPSMQSLTKLFYHLRQKKNLSWNKVSDREAEAATFFWFKLSIPLACLLAIFGPAPYCLTFTRTLPIFFIFAISLASMIAFFTLIHACAILGKSQVIPPFVAILIPQTLCFFFAGWKYAKL
jgi:lipopolysaccharide export system permease protein